MCSSEQKLVSGVRLRWSDALACLPFSGAVSPESWDKKNPTHEWVGE
jgi:hypothetical protein